MLHELPLSCDYNMLLSTEECLHVELYRHLIKKAHYICAPTYQYDLNADGLS